MDLFVIGMIYLNGNIFIVGFFNGYLGFFKGIGNVIVDIRFFEVMFCNIYSGVGFI